MTILILDQVPNTLTRYSATQADDVYLSIEGLFTPAFFLGSLCFESKYKNEKKAAFSLRLEASKCIILGSNKPIGTQRYEMLAPEGAVVLNYCHLPV